MNYLEKLQDPRWHHLRGLVLQRDGGACQSCFEAKPEMHVHHLRYVGEPWESPMDDLMTLCRTCHENVEIAVRVVRENPQIRTLPFLINQALKLMQLGHYSRIIKLSKIAVSMQNPSYGAPKPKRSKPWWAGKYEGKQPNAVDKEVGVAVPRGLR